MIFLDWTLIILGGLALIKNLVLLAGSLRYRIKLLAAVKEEDEGYFPRVSVIVPCKGVDPGFEENILALRDQKYENFCLVFVTGTDQDPAYSALAKIISRSSRGSMRLVTAGWARTCSQKIQNLLRGIEEVGEETEVLVFADSDIRPPDHWLRHLVAPLQDKKIGATTGYRWYMPMKGNLWSAVRSVWNMNTAFLLFEDAYNFAWGGSMAIRKETFKALAIPQRWKNGLSDDLILTQAVKQEGYKIKFVPRSLVPSFEKTTWKALVEWTTRQMIIVRIYDPRLWKLASRVQLGSNLMFLLGCLLGIKGVLTGTGVSLAAWFMMSDPLFVALMNAIRFSAFKQAMPNYRDQMKKFWWAYPGLSWVVTFLMALNFMKASRTNQIEWRGIRYELRSPNETAILHEGAMK